MTSTRRQTCAKQFLPSARVLLLPRIRLLPDVLQLVGLSKRVLRIAGIKLVTVRTFLKSATPMLNGAALTNQVTPSLHGGVVNEPVYLIRAC